MAGRLFPATQDTSITAASSGQVTVASTAAYRNNMHGYLSASGQAGMTIQVVTVVDGTHLMVRQILEPRGGGVGTTAADMAAGNKINYGFTDVSAYNGGTINIPEQFVYNPNDLGLS